MRRRDRRVKNVRQRPLAVGDTLEVALEFADGQTLTVAFHAISATSS